jgi:hypothetical protein
MAQSNLAFVRRVRRYGGLGLILAGSLPEASPLAPGPANGVTIQRQSPERARRESRRERYLPRRYPLLLPRRPSLLPRMNSVGASLLC